MRNVASCTFHQALRSCLLNNAPRHPAGQSTAGNWVVRWNLLKPNTSIHYRTAKTYAAINLSDLSQSSLQPERSVPRPQDNGPQYPTVVQQARENMQKYENCILLTKVGGFYELYFEHAEKYGPLLNLKVAQKKTAAGPVPMAGFPFFQLDRFLKILVQDLNQFVAISEEFANNASENVRSGGLLFDRKVTRTITPGTLIDEKFIDPYENNFLLAIHPFENGNSINRTETGELPIELTQNSLSPSLLSKNVGLAWSDLSTGDFFTRITSLGMLPSVTARIGAREIVMNRNLEVQDQELILGLLEHQRHLVTRHPTASADASILSWTPMLEADIPRDVQTTFTNAEIVAGSLLLAYARDKLQSSGLKLQPPVRRHDKETMGIDKSSMRALEVLGTAKDGLGGGKGSLLHAIRRTVTKSGMRLLRDRVASPSMSLQTINERLDLVSALLGNGALREALINLLHRSYDAQRLVQKFSLGRGDADDLISLFKTIEVTNGIRSALDKHATLFSVTPHHNANEHQGTQHPLQVLSRKLSLDGPNALASLIASSIDEEGLSKSQRFEERTDVHIISMAQEVLQNEGSVEDQAAMSRVSKSKVKPKTSDEEVEDDDTWILRRTASSVLEKLHEALDELQQGKISLTYQLRDEMKAQSLSLRWTPGTGYICHVKGTRDVATSLKTSAAAREVKTTKSTRAFHHPAWSSLGGQIDQAKLRIKAEEQRVFEELRAQVVLNLVKLRRNAAVLDELDIACSFAAIAEEQGFVRPNLNLSLDHKVVGGRHPTVTLGLEEQGRAFVSNDCMIGEKERIWLITGPNMAGKSTFLRQNALISILAQVGSFVPAERADIGLVDQIFTRVGSADNLFKDQSTFMVEMMETATILKNATPQSFVIMDEIGRGTTPEDGIAVGFACLHHLYHKNRCRTLFATHFHALADMTQDFEHLECYCTDVAEEPHGSFSFVHRLRKGVNRSSHALKVARLAGIPEAAIETARTVLEGFAGRLSSPSDQKRPTETGTQNSPLK
ncbi:MutS protein 1 [Lecanora helva]